MKEEDLASLRAHMEQQLEEEVHVRQEAIHKLELQLLEMSQECSCMQQRLEEAEADKERALKELSDRLTHTYKTELEGLRSRFRLMATTSMERSPSDSSLEKIEVCYKIRTFLLFLCKLFLFTVNCCFIISKFVEGPCEPP
jgi:RB1-inducible coiled-coil protein 1